MQMIRLLAILAVVILLVGCTPTISNDDVLNKLKANNDAVTAAKTTIQQQAATIAALQGQVAQLQKQLAASDNRSGQFVTLDTFNKALAASAASTAQTDIMKRLAVVEANNLMIKSDQTILKADVSRSLNNNQARIDAAVNSLGASSPVMATLVSQQAQIDALTLRLNNAGMK